MSKRQSTGRRLASALAVVVLFPSISVFAQVDEANLPYDANAVIGAGKCGECHATELLSWQNSHHYKTFKNLPASPLAEEISDKMDIFDITEESTCLECHFTLRKTTPTAPLKAVSGVSCELCHKPAKNWVDHHNAGVSLGKAYKSGGAETREQWLARITKAREAGMKSTDNIYDFVQSCFQCHTVPREKLVNVGGHKAGSPFEFVAWSQGEVRHNFLASTVKNGNRDRAELQLMYVIGRAVDLEYAFRGLSAATSDAPYAQAMAARALKAHNELVKIINADADISKEKVAIPEITDMIAAVPEKFMFNSKDKYVALADRVQKAARAIVEKQENYKLELAKVDRLVPLRNKFKGEPFRD